LRGVFVTGTDTEVGKSVVAAAICAVLAARGEDVAAFKPVVTGLDEEPGQFGRDHELLAGAAGSGQTPSEVALHAFGPPVSPHLAAVLVCEGVGGLMVPITTGYLVRDLAVDLGLPVVVAARPGLGTINHTLLTVGAARAAGLRVAGIVMTPWPSEPSAMERSNRETIARLSGTEVSALPLTTPEELAEAGASLPVDHWL
jgi:dethiobiotin synthetase